MWKKKEKKEKKESSIAEMRKLQRPEDRQKTSDRKTVTAHEEDLASAIGGRAMGTKGPRQVDVAGKIGAKRSDARSDRYEAECKQTGKASLAFKLEWLLDITRLAWAQKKIPLVSLRFLAAEADVERDWIMVPMSEFRRLYELAKADDAVLQRMAGEDWYE